MLAIGEFSGYKMFYDQSRREFILEDKENRQVADAPTQAELEEKAKKLSKAAIPFPIRAIKIIGSLIYPGRITSYNLDQGEIWFVTDKGTREKITLRWEREIYEENEVNLTLGKKLEELGEREAVIDKERRELITQFTGKIDLEYFNCYIKEK